MYKCKKEKKKGKNEKVLLAWKSALFYIIAYACVCVVVFVCMNRCVHV